MFFDLYSDIHLEFRLKFHIEPQHEILVLAGDICTVDKMRNGVPQHFFDVVSKQYKHILYVMGNHEFYDSDLVSATVAFQHLIKSYPNVHLLDCTTKVIDNWSFVGGTMWTDFNNMAPLAQLQCSISMNDFTVIHDFKPYHAYQEHLRFIKYLKNHFKVADASKTVVITHHAPSYRSIPEKYKNSPINSGFASDLEDLILDLKPAFWCHGHLHNKSDYFIGNTHVLCNPAGYPGEKID